MQQLRHEQQNLQQQMQQLEQNLSNTNVDLSFTQPTGETQPECGSKSTPIHLAEHNKQMRRRIKELKDQLDTAKDEAAET